MAVEIASLTRPTFAAPAPAQPAAGGVLAGYREFLRRPLVASLTTVGPDGSPQCTPVWFEAADDVIRVSTLDSRKKATNVALNPQICLSILDPNMPSVCLEIRGTATVGADPGALFARRVSNRYAGRPYTGPVSGRVILTIYPERVIRSAAF